MSAAEGMQDGTGAPVEGVRVEAPEHLVPDGAKGRTGAPADSRQALRAWVQLLKTAKRIEGEVASHFANEHSTSLSRFDVLANLERSPGQSTGTSRLSKMLLASRGNITRLLDRMEKDRLIRRVPNPGDRRISEVHMTPAGARLFARLAPDHEGWAHDIFGVLSETELTQFIAMLRRLRRRLDEMPKSLP